MKKIIMAIMFLAIGQYCWASPYTHQDSMDEWEQILYDIEPNNIIDPMVSGWGEYMSNWQTYGEGEKYPLSGYSYPELYVYEGSETDPNYPDDDGLVMVWNAPPEENFSAAWKYIYGEDPDLRNSKISIRIFPAGWITNASIWLTDINGKQTAWNWVIPGTIPAFGFTTIVIDTSKISQGALSASPAANGFMIMPGFDLSQIVSFGVSENAYNYGGNPIPPVGQPTTNQAWNAWDRLIITRNNLKAYKGTYVKWSQPPVESSEPNWPPIIYGWDQRSGFEYNFRPLLADDWLCEDDRPVTDIHWWGSFQGWTQPYLPSVVPVSFQLGIWTDVPANPPSEPYSHPGVLVWTHNCDNWVYNFAGYDVDPRCEEDPNFQGCEQDEACFQFNQLLSEEDWFYQEPNNPEDPNGKRVYWLSIGAVYDPSIQSLEDIEYPWGWKTREHYYNDDAVWFDFVKMPSGTWTWPPQIGYSWANGGPIMYVGKSWDLTFEITTNEKPACHDIESDLNHDCKVDVEDLAIFASQWLHTQ